MNLNQSYRYSNFLDGLLVKSYYYLNNMNFVTTTKEEHLKSKANPDAQDETINVAKSFDVDFTPNDVIDFTISVINEKERLYSAIANAKITTEINIDNSISINKKKQEFISVLKNMATIKNAEVQTSGRDYKFDVNGEQKPYTYTVNCETHIDFDRNDVKKLIKKYSKECDEISNKLDEIEIITQIEFEPKWDVNDSYEDLVMSK